MIKQMLEGLAKVTESSDRAAPGVILLKYTVVNSCIISEGSGADKKVVIVDTGLESSGKYIIKSINDYFGKDIKPLYIFLTHGHFDHVGSAKELMAYYNIPVYAHENELPYLTGQSQYPEAQTDAEPGLVAKMSAHFPNAPIDLGENVHPLAGDGTLPYLKEWKWVATPGHTEGHSSLFRECDGTIIAGDAFTSTQQESLTSVLSQKENMEGPPAYFTQDKESAVNSIKKLRSLNPKRAIVSHGKTLEGDELTRNLDIFIREN